MSFLHLCIQQLPSKFCFYLPLSFFCQRCIFVFVHCVVLMLWCMQLSVSDSRWDVFTWVQQELTHVCTYMSPLCQAITWRRHANETLGLHCCQLHWYAPRNILPTSVKLLKTRVRFWKSHKGTNMKESFIKYVQAMKGGKFVEQMSAGIRHLVDDEEKDRAAFHSTHVNAWNPLLYHSHSSWIKFIALFQLLQ